ncbi:MAG: DUF4340 domain-containing protein, partial [Verrucomicrobiota bacterium]
MKLKNLLITVCVLGIIALGIWGLNEATAPKRVENAKEKLLDPSIVEKVTRISITADTTGQPIVIELKNDVWQLPHYYNLPIQFDSLQHIIDSMLDSYVGKTVSTDEKSFARYELNKTIIEFFDNEGTIVYQLKIGKSGEKQGAFIQINDEEKVSLSNINLYASQDHKGWADKNLFSFSPDEILKVSLKNDSWENPFVASRQTGDSPFTTQEELLKDHQLNHNIFQD